MHSVVDQNQKSKADIIEERRSNLPLPDDPPVASDWNSNDPSTVNVGSGGIQSDVSYGGGSSAGLRGPATSDSGARTDGETFNKETGAPGSVGRQGHDNLDGLPKDALKR
ncbi:uncharacterized protein KY384_008273 [Bacidia gigantensis]|uniref:uncharacterized protein n=1 Tax=Bacidia gigantensis TaxID=2732470 RepID=UPI001D057450|nr:uncharacterized protein KY384_008273 [Bacidia gigantensis]KAG8526844.1 hypothetical protein KY384_008273 [Bacidia gigantensis]